jgi:type III pantothenate kinase
MAKSAIRNPQSTIRNPQSPLVLLVDIGNSTLHLGLAQGRNVIWHQDIPAGAQRSPAVHLPKLKGKARVEGVVVSSVVPSLESDFARLSRDQLGVEPLLLSARVPCGIRLRYHPKSKLGPDRIANAAAAFHLYRRDTIVVDMGTATTLEVMTRQGDFIGGAIMPGLGTMLSSLRFGTATLPLVPAAVPKTALGTSTAGSIRSGVFHAHFAGIDRIIERVRHETRRQYFIVATGGLARRFGRFIHNVSAVHPLLTLQGMAIAFQLHINQSRRTYG